MNQQGFTPITDREKIAYIYQTVMHIKERLDDLPCIPYEKRLRKVEDNQSNLKGIAAIVVIVSGVVTAVINFVFGKPTMP